jgi:hypothetical protein
MSQSQSTIQKILPILSPPPGWEGQRWRTPVLFASIKVEVRREDRAPLSPGFAVTVDGRDFGGCCHDLVVAAHPELAPLVALHLSDLDGAPLHAAENAEHWLSGLLPELAAAYPYGPTAPLKYCGRSTPEDCARILADHLRISSVEVAGLVERARLAAAPALALHARRLVPLDAAREAVTAVVVAFCDAQRDRWRAEAAAGLALVESLPTYDGP